MITELQLQLALLCSHCCATIGTLQRDAPPSSVDGEALLTAPALQATPLTEQTQTMAKQVVQTAQTIDRLLKQLPDTFETEQVQLSQIQMLQQHHREAGVVLQQTIRLAKQQLEVVQDHFSEVADQQMRTHSP